MDFTREIFDEIERMNESDLKWARDTLDGPEFKWNAFLAGCGFLQEEINGKDFYRSKENSDIYFRLNRSGVRGGEIDYDHLGIYQKTNEEIKMIHCIGKSSLENTIREKLEKIIEKNPEKYFWEI